MDNEYYSITGEKLETSRQGSFPIASLISVTEFMNGLCLKSPKGTVGDL